MQDLNSAFSEISEEVILLHNQILDAAKDNPQIKELYKGYQLLFSPLKHKPKFLLIGFNPGGGYAKWHGKIVEEFTPMPALEYYLNKHSLGEQTKSLFAMAGKESDLKNSTVKINFYPWATENVADFNRLVRLLPNNLSSQIFDLARVWTKKIIEILEPSTIICEGFKAFEEVQVLFPEKYKHEQSDFHKSFLIGQETLVLGYKRNQGSIIGKDAIIEAFNTILPAE